MFDKLQKDSKRLSSALVDDDRLPQVCVDEATSLLFLWSVFLLLMPIILLMFDRAAYRARRAGLTWSLRVIIILGGIINVLVILRFLAEVPCLQ